MELQPLQPASTGRLTKASTFNSLFKNLTPDEVAQQIAELLHSSTSPDILALGLKPLITRLRQEAEIAATEGGNLAETGVWQVTEAQPLADALKSYVASPGFGGELDPLCQWLYEWCRSEPLPLLRRFVARYAPQLAAQYLLCTAAWPTAPPCPGLEACMVAMYEAQAATLPQLQGMPGVAQTSHPSPQHQPSTSPTQSPAAAQGQRAQQPVPSTSAAEPSPPLPPGLASLFGTAAESSMPARLSGVQAWQRAAVAGAAFAAYTAWMSSFPDAAIAHHAAAAASVCIAGCPWMGAEMRHLAQQHGLGKAAAAAAELASGKAAQGRRVQLPADIVEPLAHGLAHAVWRLGQRLPEGYGRATAAPNGNHVGALDGFGAASAAGTGQEGRQQQHAGPSASNGPAEDGMATTNGGMEGTAHGLPAAVEELLTATTGAVLALHVRATYALDPPSMLITQAVLTQLTSL